MIVPGRLADLWAARHDRRGMSAVEFALALPLLMFMGLGGLEVANMALANSRVNQIAIALADNASRMKQQTIGSAPHFRESDAVEALLAAERQGGDLQLMQNGRAILSSLQVNPDGGQWIKWQRCRGTKTTYASNWGAEGTGATGTAFAGIGSATKTIAAEPQSAIMVAEVVYEYRPLIVDSIFDTMTIRKYAAMYVRDERDLSQIYASPPTVASTC